MLKVLAENYMDILTRYRQNLEDPTSIRLCRLLIEFAGMQNGMLVMPSFFTYAELARYLGTHPVTIARIMSKLKEDGCISKHGKSTIILDPKRIQKMIDQNTPIDY
jgi:CRP-like cAMP-binding protein